LRKRRVRQSHDRLRSADRQRGEYAKRGGPYPPFRSKDTGIENEK